jgi:hypothetical protein
MIYIAIFIYLHQYCEYQSEKVRRRNKISQEGKVLTWRGDVVLRGPSKTDRSNTGTPTMVDCQVRHSQLCKIIQTQDIYVQTSAVNSIRGWLVRMSKNLWVPDRCWPRNCTSIAPISLRRSSENYISPSGKYLTLRGNFISTYLLHYEKPWIRSSQGVYTRIPIYKFSKITGYTSVWVLDLG